MRIGKVAKKSGQLVLASGTKISSIFFAAIAVTMAGGVVTAFTHSGASVSDERFPASVREAVGEPGASGSPNPRFKAFAVPSPRGGSQAGNGFASQLQQAAEAQAAQNAASGAQPEPIMVTPDPVPVARANPGQQILAMETSATATSTGTSVSTATGTAANTNNGSSPYGPSASSTATSTAASTAAYPNFYGPAAVSLATSANGWAGVCQKVAVNLVDGTSNPSGSPYPTTVTLTSDRGGFYSDADCATGANSAAFDTGTASVNVYFKASATASLTANEPTLGDSAPVVVTVGAGAASIAEGQANLISGNSNQGGISAATLNAPGAVLRVNGKLVVADTTNNRVLIWNTVPASSGVAADIVLGQPTMGVFGANNGGVSAISLSAPTAVASDGTRLVVADSGNNRVLIWDTFPVATRAPASHVAGQPTMADFAPNNVALGGATMRNPTCALLTAGKLVVCDKDNNRVLVWNSVPASDGVSATFAIGQADLTHAGTGTSALTLTAPYDAFVSASGRLYVSDYGNNRVLLWSSFPADSTVGATVALGQPNLAVGNPNNGAQDAGSLTGPARARVDSQGRLLVVDSGNHRVLLWNKEPTVTATVADGVLGQPSFAIGGPNQGGLGAASLDAPLGMDLTGSELWIADSSNSRVLEYSLP